MQITHKDFNKRNGMFNAVDNGKVVGEMTYVWTDANTIAINHTSVAPQYEGQGVGRKMIDKAVEYARENNLKIIPICIFVKTIFARSDDYGDICL